MAQVLPDLLARAAQAHPGHTAVVCEAAALTYAELKQRADALAEHLLGQGVHPGDRVGILMEKRLETPVAVFGILQAGCAYVPLDRSAPVARLQRIIEDCEISCLVTSDTMSRMLQALADADSLPPLIVGASLPERPQSTDWTVLADKRADTPAVKIRHDSDAYIIYTSGSTGVPKGIAHTHFSSLSFVEWAAPEYGIQSDDRVANHSALHFDISIFDLFVTTCAAATLVIIPEPILKLPASYTALLSRDRVTVLFTVPFALTQMLLHGALHKRTLTCLRWVIFGGEPFPAKHLRALMQALPGARFDNMYGPAEINGCTHHTVDAADFTEPLPIGRLAHIARCHIVDAEDQPVAAGATGVLLVHTPAMMRGYWGRADLNAAAFLDLHEGGVVKRYYRTGDLVRDSGDGTLVFVGRADRQIKIRGYRVELDEIEALLGSHPAVAVAAAFPTAQASLAAAVVLHRSNAVKGSELVSFAKSQLPAYCVPTSIGVLEQLPLTTSGKIDRRALAAAHAGGQSTEEAH